ncbi:hypothetical protein GGR52DRAFT_555280 [Hypoxylon sp. FL1284]|nr:hypothetical protein GGR52DRAFT_555280 [Hypoxylon sp. FL1284]
MHLNEAEQETTATWRLFLRRGVKVGPGTDSGGGFSSSILNAVRQALVASNAREVTSGGADKGLEISELFYVATLGGSAPGVMTMLEDQDFSGTIFEKFIMTGDDRNTKEVYVRGYSVKP